MVCIVPVPAGGPVALPSDFRQLAQGAELELRAFQRQDAVKSQRQLRRSDTNFARSAAWLPTGVHELLGFYIYIIYNI